MPIQVDAYTAGGVASGVLARAGHLREVLEHDGVLDARARPVAAARRDPVVQLGRLSIADRRRPVAVGDDDPIIPVHAAWHAIRIEVGPYAVEGELPTLPGFDPGRALARPTGEFVLLRDVALGGGPRQARPSRVPIGHHALVNRYGVERVAGDLMLGFFFPGAEMIQADVAETGAI